jgi:hypothetical protein
VRIVLAVALLGACFYPEKIFTGTTDAKQPDGFVPDGHVVFDAPEPVPDGGMFADAIAGCAFPATLSPSIMSGSMMAVSQEPSGAFAQDLEWEAELVANPEQAIALNAEAGGGSASPDWPVGDVTARTGVAVTENGDAQVLLAADFNGSGVPSIIYAATSGQVSITQVTPDFAGTATDLLLVHVDQVGSGVVVDPDGCQTTISSFSFDSAVTTE